MKQHLSLEDIERLLVMASKEIHHTDYVIIGSLSIMGAINEPPLAMVTSVDLDFYPKDDPERGFDLVPLLGEHSPFREKHGYYADAVTPLLPSLPEHWEERLLPIQFSHGVTAFFLSPNDAAISKYARSEPRDRRWIRAGLEHGILNLVVIDYLLRFTVLDSNERQTVSVAVEEDRNWLQQIKAKNL